MKIYCKSPQIAQFKKYFSWNMPRISLTSRHATRPNSKKSLAPPPPPLTTQHIKYTTYRSTPTTHRTTTPQLHLYPTQRTSHHSNTEHHTTQQHTTIGAKQGGGLGGVSTPLNFGWGVEHLSTPP